MVLDLRAPLAAEGRKNKRDRKNDDEMKRIYLGTNLKMHKTNRETVSYLKELRENGRFPPPELEMFVILLYRAPEAVAAVEGEIKIGAQNMCWEDAGSIRGDPPGCSKRLASI